MSSTVGKYVFSNRFNWDYWAYTQRASIPGMFNVGAVLNTFLISDEEIEAEYPGFLNAFDILQNKGVHVAFVTGFLKYLMEQKSEENLDVVLLRLKVIDKISIGRALDFDMPTILQNLKTDLTVEPIASIDSRNLPEF